MKKIVINRPVKTQGFLVKEGETLKVSSDAVSAYGIVSKDFDGKDIIGAFMLLNHGKIIIPTETRDEALVIEKQLDEMWKENSEREIIIGEINK